MLKFKKIRAFIIILILIMCMNSCASGRVAFGPQTGAYEIMLDDIYWDTMDSQSVHQVILLYREPYSTNHGILLKIDYYSKSDMAGLSAPDFDSFIRLYKTFGEVADVYEHENGSVRELTDIPTKSMKKIPAVSGRRQQVKISYPNFESVTEFIYLETDDYYFAMVYGAEASDFIRAQSIVDDVIKNLKILKNA